MRPTLVRIAPIALAAAAGLIAARAEAADAATPANRDCFRTSEMRNHTVADPQTLYLGVSIKEVYRIGMAGACLTGAHSSDPLVIKTTGSTGLVCKPLDLDLGIRRGGTAGFTSHCIVNSITKLTPAEAAALPKKLRP